MGARVRFTRSGGFAGLSLVASVDLDALPPATAAAVRHALDQVDFDPPARPAPPGAADTYQYDLVVTDGGRRIVTAHAPLVDPGMQALSEVLLPLAKLE